MVARPALLRRLLSPLLFAPALLLAEPASDASPIPPEPQRPSLRGLSPEQEGTAMRRYHQALEEWMTNLSPQELDRHASQQATEYQKKQERFEAEFSLPDNEQEAAATNRALTRPWRDDSREAGLSASEIERLAQDKILIEDRQLKQSFTPYIDPVRPVFITTDSLLNGFHVLLEDSIGELEKHRIAPLRRHLEGVVPRVRAEISRTQIPAVEFAAAIRQAEYVVGTALTILGGSLDGFSPETRDEIVRQVALIHAATAQELPPWLGPKAAGLIDLDYRRCRPLGFYASDPKLADYFRAVRWLQMVPFRANRDTELLAAALLELARTDEEVGFYTGLSCFADIAVRSPYADIAIYRPEPEPWTKSAADFLKGLRARASKGSVPLFGDIYRDGHRLEPANDNPLELLESRFLPSFGTDIARTFLDLGEQNIEPNGLIFAAGVGSDFALFRLPPQSATAALRLRTQDSNDPAVPNIHSEYLALLSTLVVAPDRDAPAFMRNEAWAAKSCQTVLAGWAQYQHTFTLQFRLSADYESATMALPGFIEPNPEFFARAGNLAASTAAFFERQGTFSNSPDREAMALRRDTTRLRELGPVPDEKPRERSSRTLEQREIVLELWVHRNSQLVLPAANSIEARRLALIAALTDRAEKLEKGLIPPSPVKDSLAERWLQLGQLANRLAHLSHKQLRSLPWSPDDRAFIRQYGENLGFVMGYGGNAWASPRDDAPRWAEIHRQPAADRSFAIGIGRPRLIHVLYPYEGREVLCTGSVMSYYEYWERDRLTDEEWKAKLDSPAAPPMPDWLTPILAK